MLKLRYLEMPRNLIRCFPVVLLKGSNKYEDVKKACMKYSEDIEVLDCTTSSIFQQTMKFRKDPREPRLINYASRLKTFIWWWWNSEVKRRSRENRCIASVQRRVIMSDSVGWCKNLHVPGVVRKVIESRQTSYVYVLSPDWSRYWKFLCEEKQCSSRKARCEVRQEQRTRGNYRVWAIWAEQCNIHKWRWPCRSKQFCDSIADRERVTKHKRMQNDIDAYSKTHAKRKSALRLDPNFQLTRKSPKKSKKSGKKPLVRWSSLSRGRGSRSKIWSKLCRSPSRNFLRPYRARGHPFPREWTAEDSIRKNGQSYCEIFWKGRVS